MPPLRYIEMYLAAAAEEEAKQSPQSVEEALNSTQKGKWEEAMKGEMDSLRENGVFDFVDKPRGKKVVKSKWVLRVKTNEIGEIEKYKARVAAKGYSQVEGVDYDQTFSPTVRFDTIRYNIRFDSIRYSIRYGHIVHPYHLFCYTFLHLVNNRRRRCQMLAGKE